jgi:hypothetical protein
MSLRAVIESTVHIEHFRNIDLFNQGFYALRIKLYHMDGLNKVYSDPLEITLAETAEKKRECFKENNKNWELSDVTQGFLDDSEHSFFTRSFVIRYFDEEVEVNDLWTFRSEIEVKDGFLNTEFYIEADLFYIELKNMGTAKLPEKVQQVVETFPLKSVSKSVLKVTKFAHGVSEYFPIVFEGQFFCQFNCTLHSCLTDLKFRAFPVVSEESGGQYNAESEAKYFFKNEKGEIPEDLNYKKVDKVYNEYINILSHMYDRMTGKFKRYISECFEAEQVEQLEDRVRVPSLKLPGDELFNESLNEEEGSKSPGLVIEKSYSIQPPKSPNDLLEDSDTECAIETTENLSEEKTVTKIPVLKNRQKNFMNKKIIPFSERHYLLSDPIKIAKKILEELSYVSLQLSDVWNRINECIRIEPKFILEFLKVDYDQKIREKWCENVYRKVVITEDFTCHIDENFEDIHSKFIVDRMENGYQSKIGQLTIQDLNLWSKPELHPMLIEHWYQKKGKYSTDNENSIETESEWGYEGYYPGWHMVIFVHGFQGSCTDMKVLKNYFSILHPDAVFLVSEANHNNTENWIEEMGEKLAKEISNKIDSYCPDSLGRLSFIGHSMGGIIIRAALPFLEKYKDQMFTYMSLSTPHLGYMYNASKIINAGMWIMKKWKRSKSLTQLSMTDASKLEDTFLYKLSCCDGLNWFKNIVLISSYKDSYAPFDSARIQSWTQATMDMKNGEFYIKMANNILEKLVATSLHRIDVNFMISEKSIDAFIGRTAHIHFLENQYFMRILSHRFVEYFD